MRKFKGLLALLVVFALMFSLAACSTNNATKPQDTSQTATEIVKTQFPLKVTDFLGREVTIEKEPQRIVSLAPSTTELIYALGAGNKVVGVTDFDNYPPEVKDVPKVGGFKGPNVEAITAQKPDIIFASTLSGKEQMESLEKMGIPVVMLEAKDIDQIYQSIKIIGQITGTEKKGEEIIKEMQDKIKEINDKVKNLPKVSVFYLVSLDGNWTSGKGTFIDELINLAGGKNVAEDVNGWAQYSVEELVKKNPDVIITSPHAGDVKDIKNMAGYKDTNAVKNDKVFVISNDDIISRASNRIVLGLEEIAKFLHPEAFK
ncbi:ABC transporter substrate-binding protein [Thermoanaerobacter siderophilus]|uniref:ABC-type Fe3+-hydroxamate transport system, periplasmic component n=1 Tax=Thermoanaerobacter siderophilus SR4 TaxID=880478 RepID=I8QWB8_9THEO|nr:ABC transporter substrate-binding protein [Thermoanaerobacter siderophilus]EIV99222.1 ABC-type Fe3+-hydroxamate transport system, periplasmic component [Thermoanaerobacter siderophilus SR4]